jgi:capsular exopolysaccharide synthesis family protein
MKDFQNSSTEGNKDTHLLDYLNVIRQRLPLFIIIVVAVLCLAMTYAFIKTPMYLAESKILIEPASLKVTDIKGVYDPSSDMRSREEFFATQIELMTSETIMGKVFNDLKFANTEDYMRNKNPFPGFKNLFKISRLKGTYILNVACMWKNPVLAADASRSLAKIYAEDFEQRSFGFSDQGLVNLQNQLNSFKQERKEAVEALLAYKKKNKMFDLEDAKQLLAARMVKVNEALIEAKVAETSASAAFKSISSSSSVEENAKKYPDISTNQTVTSFKLERLRMMIEELNLLSEYNENHKKVINQQKIIQYIGAVIKDEVVGEYERAKLLKSLLAEDMDNLQEESFLLDDQAAEYKVLKDNYDARAESYKLVLKRINEITITQASGKVDAAGNIQIISMAQVPKAVYSPKKVKILAMAFIMGLMLAGGVCFGLDYLDRTVKFKEQAEEIVHSPVLGFLPKLENDDNKTPVRIRPMDIFTETVNSIRLSLGLPKIGRQPKCCNETDAIRKPLGAFAEAVNSIRTSLGLSILGRQTQCFMVTSAVQEEGKTLLAFNMALSFSRVGKKVLLMECDMRKPRLTQLLGEYLPVKNGPGLSSVLVGTTDMEDIVNTIDGVQGLDIAFCGHIPPNPSELLDSQNFKDLIAKVKSRYDIVILDTPPLLHVSDSIMLAGSYIPVVLVTRVFNTKISQLKMAVEQIKNVQGIIVGVVINNVETSAEKLSGYYYDGYYHKPEQTG